MAFRITTGKETLGIGFVLDLPAADGVVGIVRG